MSTLAGIDTRFLFTAVFALVVVERLVELRISLRNERRALERGGFEAGAGHYPWMVRLHSLFLASCLAEVWLLERPFLPWLGGAMALLLASTMALRYWVISTLGGRWTTRVIVVPGEPPVTGGPYRFLRHPNYLGVILELLALPLLHTAWLTAGCFLVANAVLLRVRIRVEEAALEKAGGYTQALGDRGRLVPKRREAEAR